MLAPALLAFVLLQLAVRLAGRRSLAARLLPEPYDASPYPVWAARLWLSFGLPALAALWLLGRVDALWLLPPEFAPAAVHARVLGVFQAWPILLGLLLGSAFGTLFAWWRRRRGGRPFYLGRPPRLPGRARELPGAALVALSAGVTEEVYFRLLLPLLLTLVTGSAVAAVLLSALLFGGVHRYQGWVGVVATALVGLFLSGVHLASGSLWLTIAVHAAIDVNALVIRPALAFSSPAGR